MDIAKYRVQPGQEFKLNSFDPNDDGGLSKDIVKKVLMPENIDRLQDLQEKFYASNTYGFLFVIQAMDTAGKDGLIKHVMGGLNPAGTVVTSFKQPSEEEKDRDYLWRVQQKVPRRGNIGIFNRSHYEEVLIARVHNLVEEQQIPEQLVTEDIWEQRYRQIRDWERYLTENGIAVVKVFLHISKEEQRIRLLDRIWQPDKHWKFSPSDVEERQYWDQYQKAYELMLRNTSTDYAPWYIVPSDRKWFSRYLASEILREHLESLDFDFPEVSEEGLRLLEQSRDILLNEPGAPPYIPEDLRGKSDSSDASVNVKAGKKPHGQKAADQARSELENKLREQKSVGTEEDSSGKSDENSGADHQGSSGKKSQSPRAKSAKKSKSKKGKKKK